MCMSVGSQEMSKVDSKEWRLMERGWVHGCADFRTATLKLLQEGGQTVSEASDQQRDIHSTIGGRQGVSSPCQKSREADLR